MTRIEKAELLAQHKLTLLNTFNTPDEAKQAKKEFNKYNNTLHSKSYKAGAKFDKLAWEAHKTFGYGEERDNSPVASAVWQFISFSGYCNTLCNKSQNLDLIKNDFSELYNAVLEPTLELEKEAKYLVKLEEHIISELARFKGSTAQQFLLQASKSAEISREKQDAFYAYSSSLADWEPSEIINDTIFVNGKEYIKGDIVGVMIGRGNRVHKMSLSIGIHTDKETKVETQVIYISNRTQWRNSSLVILDLIDNIPSELYSETGW